MSANSLMGPDRLYHERVSLLGRLRRRILVSIAASVIWLSTVLLFLAFWATRFTIFQDIVVIVVSLVVLAGALLGAWVSFGLRFVNHWFD